MALRRARIIRLPVTAPSKEELLIMKIGVTSQNFRTITGHAGKTRRFLIFSENGDGIPAEIDRLDLPKEMSMHEFRGTDHPIEQLDILITGSCGDGFKRRLASRNVRVITTGEQDPLKAVTQVLSGESLAPPLPHDHQHGS